MHDALLLDELGRPISSWITSAVKICGKAALFGFGERISMSCGGEEIVAVVVGNLNCAKF